MGKNIFYNKYLEDIYHANRFCQIWLPLKERRVKLFNHEIIEIGRQVKLKWKRIVQGKQEDHGQNNCAYCKRFYESNKKICCGCPIEYFTKGPECIATPYLRLRDIRSKIKSNFIFNEDDHEKYNTLAKEMRTFVDKIFIRSLLLIDWRKYYEMH